MLDGLFPRQIDNDYRGHPAAPWLMIVVVSVRIAQSLLVLCCSYYVVILAEALPLDRYPAAASQAIAFAMAGWKVDRLLIALLCLLAIDRYRSMIPLMLTVLLLQELGRRAVAWLYPMTTDGVPGATRVNLVLLMLTAIALVLSLRRRAVVSSSA
ncbi:MAG TPA: hypothetical protein VLV78_04670 [Thermoanaerobaculia bacterium]|nr:hypothetical protein [Thermoanaerobaculia bacterium]